MSSSPESGDGMRKPQGLQREGTALWDEVVEAYDLRLDEQRLLEHACRTVDELERLRQPLADSDIVVVGSTGQPRTTPLIAEVRGHRQLLSRLVQQLDLPDLDAPAQRSALSQRKAAAANARWDRVRAAREAAEA
jgi:hypothetical protein